jgi:hypothetical protein
MRPADPFARVREVAAFLADFPRPWFISGGWAIDLFLDRVTRDHEDVDVAIFRRDQRDLRTYLAVWTLEKVVEGRRELWREGEWLNLPVHEIHARRASVASGEIEFLLNEAADDQWVFRRDPRIQRPISKSAMRTSFGIPSSPRSSSSCTRRRTQRPKTKRTSNACGPISGSRGVSGSAAP